MQPADSQIVLVALDGHPAGDNLTESLHEVRIATTSHAAHTLMVTIR